MPRGKNYVNNNKGVSIQPPNKGQKSMEQCYYGAGCTRSDCIYRHDAKQNKTVRKSAEPCMPFLAGVCSLGAGCLKRHPGKAEAEKLVAKYKTTKCRHGDHCKTKDCLYIHPRDEKNEKKDDLKSKEAEFPPLPGNPPARAAILNTAWRPAPPPAPAGPTLVQQQASTTTKVATTTTQGATKPQQHQQQQGKQPEPQSQEPSQAHFPSAPMPAAPAWYPYPTAAVANMPIPYYGMPPPLPGQHLHPQQQPYAHAAAGLYPQHLAYPRSFSSNDTIMMQQQQQQQQEGMVYDPHTGFAAAYPRSYSATDASLNINAKEFVPGGQT